MKRVTLLVCVIAMIAFGLVVYARVGWSRMETACSAGPSGDPEWHSVHYAWSWSPTGFQCTYEDRRQRTSLWF